MKNVFGRALDSKRWRQRVRSEGIAGLAGLFRLGEVGRVGKVPVCTGFWEFGTAAVENAAAAEELYMSRKIWVHVSNWLVRFGALTMVGLMGLSIYKYGDMKFTRPRPDPDRGWIYRIGTGGYGTLEESREAYWLFHGGFAGFVLIAAGKGIRIYKLGEQWNAPTAWTFRDRVKPF